MKDPNVRGVVHLIEETFGQKGWGELVQVHFRPGNLSGVARRAARDRHPQPLTAFHAAVRTAREKSGFKAGLRRREKSGLEHG